MFEGRGCTGEKDQDCNAWVTMYECNIEIPTFIASAKNTAALSWKGFNVCIYGRGCSSEKDQDCDLWVTMYECYRQILTFIASAKNTAALSSKLFPDSVICVIVVLFIIVLLKASAHPGPNLLSDKFWNKQDNYILHVCNLSITLYHLFSLTDIIVWWIVKCK